jgi:hypothetical protein
LEVNLFALPAANLQPRDELYAQLIILSSALRMTIRTTKIPIQRAHGSACLLIAIFLWVAFAPPRISPDILASQPA